MRRGRLSACVHELSCGAVIFRRRQTPEFLLLRHPGGHWDFPKGHVEKDETDLQAAQREIMEETGIAPSKLSIREGFLEENKYSFRRGRQVVTKTVKFFLAESATGDVRLSDEHTGYAWLPYREAREQITYENAKRVLDAAWNHMRQAGLHKL